MITKFDEYNEEKHYGSVGVVFLYDNKVLLVHPTGFGVWSYPKGHIEDGEVHKETAMREVEEELNIKLPTDFLDNIELQELDPVYKKGNGVKHYWFYKYILRPEEFNKYFHNSLIIPTKYLQLDEVDEARFVDIDDAKKLLDHKFLGILDN